MLACALLTSSSDRKVVTSDPFVHFDDIEGVPYADKSGIFGRRHQSRPVEPSCEDLFFLFSPRHHTTKLPHQFSFAWLERTTTCRDCLLPHKLTVFINSTNTDNMDFSPQMFRNIPKVAYDHYKEGNLNYPMIIYVSLVHIVAVAGLFALPKCSKETLLWAFILWPIR